jgi:RecB family exonuclease
MARSYSFSQINTFNTCPRKYKFQYIERANVEKPVGVEMFLGNAVHHILQVIYSLKSNGKIISEDEMLEMYNKYWNGPDREHIKVTRENLGIDDYIKKGADLLRKYFRKYHPFEECEILGLEKNVVFPIIEGKFQIKGKIDRLSRSVENGNIEIVDYKTDRNLQTQQSLERDEQMGLYNLGVKYLWPDFERVILKKIFLRHDMELTTEMNQEVLEEIEYKVYHRILEIEQSVRDDNFPAKETALCDWCVYYQLCPAKRHGLALDDEIVDDFDADYGKTVAERYLQLDHEKKKLESELKELKKDIVSWCEKNEVTSVSADHGTVNVSITETEGFPSKKENEDAYFDISRLVRDADLSECFKLDQNVLFKDFYVKNRLPDDLREKLEEFKRTRKKEVVRTQFKGK